MSGNRASLETLLPPPSIGTTAHTAQQHWVARVPEHELAPPSLPTIPAPPPSEEVVSSSGRTIPSPPPVAFEEAGVDAEPSTERSAHLTEVPPVSQIRRSSDHMLAARPARLRRDPQTAISVSWRDRAVRPT